MTVNDIINYIDKQVLYSYTIEYIDTADKLTIQYFVGGTRYVIEYIGISDIKSAYQLQSLVNNIVDNINYHLNEKGVKE